MKTLLILLTIAISTNVYSSDRTLSVETLAISYHYIAEGLNEEHHGLGISYYSGDHTYSAGQYLNSYNTTSTYVSFHNTLRSNSCCNVALGVILANGYSNNTTGSTTGIVLMPSIKVGVRGEVFYADLAFTPAAVGLILGAHLF